MIIHGDALTELRKLESGIVQTCITSPPYWGLRDYGMDGQLGLEPTPEEYVASLVTIFAEVKRVLRDDGTLWLVLGDTYNSSPSNQQYKNVGGGIHGSECILGRLERNIPGLKPKDLVGIPWRVAFALQADGWYLRSDIIWAKPNPMPESVTDRPTSAHEHIFLLAKSQRYYYDADAVREEHLEVSLKRIEYGLKHTHPADIGVGIPPVDTDRMGERFCNPAGRNKRNVWTVATQPYPEAHFAVFPPALIEPCVLAGSAGRACEVCGAPWERVVEREKSPQVDPSEIDRYGTGEAGVHRKVGGQYQKWLDENPSQTTGFQPTCTCDNEGTGQSIVLDPFLGSGTTAEVALKHRREFIGIELNPEYVELAEKRLREVEVVMF